jgi:thiol-disulfide isomerase/thioredoxin
MKRELMREKIRQILARNDALAGNHAPDFGSGHEWLNVSRPLALHRDLHGKLVLVDFWTYCCINCMHVLPDLEYLEEKYRDEPVAFVGCHSAKFTNEADAANVREAVIRYRIRHPVVVDEDFRIWRSYGIRGWPGMVLISPEARILASVGGEGNRDLLDLLIEEALALYRQKGVPWNRDPLPIRLEADAKLTGDLSYPGKLVAAPGGSSLFVSDSNHNRVIEISLDGQFLNAIGSGEAGSRDGTLEKATFDRPQGLAFHGRALLVADTENHRVRRVDLDAGLVTTIAGAGGQGHERRGYWPAREVSLNSPWDLHVRGDDAYVAMAGPHQVWRLDLARGVIEAWAGDGSERRLDGTREECGFAQPSGLATDGEWLYVADSEASAIRAIRFESGEVRTLAGGGDDPRDLFHFGDEDGTGAGRRFQHPLGVHVAGGVLYVADAYNHKVKTVELATGRVTTLAGDGSRGTEDGSRARFSEPSGLWALGRKLYIADSNNHRVRVLDLRRGDVSTLALRGVPIPRRHTLRPSAPPACIPDFPGMERAPEREVTLKPGNAVIRAALRPPGGRKLAEGSPHVYEVHQEGAALAFEAPRGTFASETLAIPAKATAGESSVVVRVLYYHCGDDLTCQLETMEWPLRVTVATAGDSEIELQEPRE